MKKLILCRHAKSTWKYSVSDIHRPLNARGLRQAPLVAHTCKEKPDLVLTSPAVRAYSTALIYCRELNWCEKDIVIEPKLYDVYLQEMVSLIANFEEDVTSAMLFGHNPWITELTEYLVTQDVDNIVTSARVTVELNIERWRDIKEGCGQLIEHIIPAHLE